MAMKTSSRSGTVRLVAIHTAEGARTRESLYNFFSTPSTQASSHVGIDGRGIMNYVPYDRASWTLRSGNPISDNAELCGFARWSRAQWLSTGTVDGCYNPAAMLENAIMWIRARCVERLIPIRKLTPAQVAAGQAGVIGHIDWTLGKKDGTHTDPGPNFPWDYVIAKAAGTVTTGGVTVADPTTEEIKAMLWAGGNVPGTVAVGTLVNIAREIRAMLWAGGNVPGNVAQGSLVDVAREIRSMLWAGGVVEGNVLPGSVVDQVNRTRADVEELNVKLDAVMAKLDELSNQPPA